MDKIILLPLIISAAMLISREPKDVFILVFLPSLTLLPTYFDVELVSGTPELYFWSAALLPILAAWMLRGFEGYHLHWMDLVILGYLLSIFYGQWANSDYKKSQKLLFTNYFDEILRRMWPGCYSSKFRISKLPERSHPMFALKAKRCRQRPIRTRRSLSALIARVPIYC
jgi:hypothetical protein